VDSHSIDKLKKKKKLDVNDKNISGLTYSKNKIDNEIDLIGMRKT
jgi:hypothetical protein